MLGSYYIWSLIWKVSCSQPMSHLSINIAICLLILSHLQVALNSFIVQKDVIWSMIHLMRKAHRWAVCRDRRLQTVALWIEFQSEVKEKKIPRRLNLIPKLEAQHILALKAYPFWIGNSFYDLRFKAFLSLSISLSSFLRLSYLTSKFGP